MHECEIRVLNQATLKTLRQDRNTYSKKSARDAARPEGLVTPNSMFRSHCCLAWVLLLRDYAIKDVFKVWFFEAPIVQSNPVVRRRWTEHGPWNLWNRHHEYAPLNTCRKISVVKGSNSSFPSLPHRLLLKYNSRSWISGGFFLWLQEHFLAK